jgi:hypothetical protein
MTLPGGDLTAVACHTIKKVKQLSSKPLQTLTNAKELVPSLCLTLHPSPQLKETLMDTTVNDDRPMERHIFFHK